MRTTFVSMLLVAGWLLPTPAPGATPASDDELARYAVQVLETAYPDASASGAAVLVARGGEVVFRDARQTDALQVARF